jgi:hypothetical protein
VISLLRKKLPQKSKYESAKSSAEFLGLGGAALLLDLHHSFLQKACCISKSYGIVFDALWKLT